jgi:hypothetical protein
MRAGGSKRTPRCVPRAPALTIWRGSMRARGSPSSHDTRVLDGSVSVPCPLSTVARMVPFSTSASCTRRPPMRTRRPACTPKYICILPSQHPVTLKGSYTTDYCALTFENLLSAAVFASGSMVCTADVQG